MPTTKHRTPPYLPAVDPLERTLWKPSLTANLPMNPQQTLCGILDPRAPHPGARFLWTSCKTFWPLFLPLNFPMRPPKYVTTKILDQPVPSTLWTFHDHCIVRVWSLGKCRCHLGLPNPLLQAIFRPSFPGLLIQVAFRYSCLARGLNVALPVRPVLSASQPPSSKI